MYDIIIILLPALYLQTPLVFFCSWANLSFYINEAL